MPKAWVEELKELKGLQLEGILSDEEFEAEKAKVMANKDKQEEAASSSPPTQPLTPVGAQLQGVVYVPQPLPPVGTQLSTDASDDGPADEGPEAQLMEDWGPCCENEEKTHIHFDWKIHNKFVVEDHSNDGVCCVCLADRTFTVTLPKTDVPEDSLCHGVKIKEPKDSDACNKWCFCDAFAYKYETYKPVAATPDPDEIVFTPPADCKTELAKKKRAEMDDAESYRVERDAVGLPLCFCSPQNAQVFRNGEKIGDVEIVNRPLPCLFGGQTTSIIAVDGQTYILQQGGSTFCCSEAGGPITKGSNSQFGKFQVYRECDPCYDSCFYASVNYDVELPEDTAVSEKMLLVGGLQMHNESFNRPPLLHEIVHNWCICSPILAGAGAIAAAFSICYLCCTGTSNNRKWGIAKCCFNFYLDEG